jgi:uncharacterized protein YoxC
VETVVETAEVLALVCASALCVYLIVVLVRFNKVLLVLQTELTELGRGLKPILENLNTITEKMREIAAKVDDQVNIVHGVFLAFKRISDSITLLEERFQARLQEPLMRVGTIFGGLINRVASLFGGGERESF